MGRDTGPPLVAGFTVDPGSAPLTPQDLAILGQVEDSIGQGRQLRAWWEANRGTRVQMSRFPIARQIHRPDTNYGFILDAYLHSGALPVAGVVQDQLFAWPKVAPATTPDPAWVRAQVREFVFKYFMRLAGTRPPRRAGEAVALIGALPARPEDRASEGWGYSQMYYQLAATGAIGKFPAGEQARIVPLDEIGRTYRWIVFKVDIYQFDYVMRVPGAANGPRLTLSMTQPVHTVMTPEFLLDEENPGPGVLGRYGYGYSVVPDPSHETLVAAGPASITNTIETLSFSVMESGEVRAHMNFITPVPARILNLTPVSLAFGVADVLSFNTASKVFAPLKTLLQSIEPPVDPVYFSLDLINLLTLGIASEEFGLNRKTMFTSLMNLHFTDVYNMFNLAASHFAMVRDWTDTAALPDWATTGVYTPPG